MPGTTLDRMEIQRAIKCDDWQRLRVSLKGETTEDKLKKLQRYLDQGRVECCDDNTKYVQVLNYLHALSRGGQLFALTQDEILTLQFNKLIRVRIQR